MGREKQEGPRRRIFGEFFSVKLGAAGRLPALDAPLGVRINARMKNHFPKALAAILLALAPCAGPTLALAQEPARIEFPKGAGTQTVKGTGDKSYVVRIGANLSCKMKLTSPKNAAKLTVLDAKGMDQTEGSNGRSFEGGFAEAGDFKVNVNAKAGVAWTLTVSLKKD